MSEEDTTLRINIGDGTGNLEWDPKDKESLLGEGAFGSVYRGTMDYQEVAIKVIKKSSRGSAAELTPGEKAAQSQHNRELRRWKKIKHHPCIVQFFGSAEDPVSGESLIVTELLNGGTLHDSLSIMRNKDTIPENAAFLDELSFLRIGGNIASGITHLHKEKMTHGDLKPHNVLLTSGVEWSSDGSCAFFRPGAVAKLMDFGLSRRTSNLMETMATTVFAPGPAGTFAYMAPQIFDGIESEDGDVACAADVYAFAVVMYEMLCGRQPWISENVRTVLHLYRYVCQENRRPDWGPRKAFIRAEYIDFVEKCWATDYKERPTSAQVVKQFHVWERAFKVRRNAGSAMNGASLVTSDLSSPAVSGVSGLLEGPDQPESYSYGPNILPSPPNGVNPVQPPDDDQLNISNLGVDEHGSPLVLRVKSNPLGEEEAKNIRKRIMTPPGVNPDDIGTSTDTRVEDSAGASEDQIREKLGDLSLSLSAAEDTIVGQPVKRVVSQPLEAAAPLPKLDDLGLPGLGLPSADVTGPRISFPLKDDADQRQEPIQNQGIGLGDSFLIAVANVDKDIEKAEEKAAQQKNPISNPFSILEQDRKRFTAPTPPQPSLPLSPPTLAIPGAPAGGATGTYCTGQVQGNPQQSWGIMTGNPLTQLQPQPQPPPQSNGLVPPTQSVPTAHPNYVPRFSQPVMSQVSVRTVLDAIQSPNGYQALDMYWNAGYGHTIALAFLNGTTQSPTILRSKLHLDMALDVLKRNNDDAIVFLEYYNGLKKRNDPSAEYVRLNNNRPFSPRIARDLCVAVGALVSSSPSAIDKATAIHTLRPTLRSMQGFPNDPLVYSACCYAMSNLLSINNRIPSARECQDVAAWIVHAISFNVRGHQSPSLAYTSASAARNFMWRNEMNTEMFLMKSHLFNHPPLQKLMVSARTFEKNFFVLETILSALATIVYFLPSRFEFVREGGIALLCDVLRQSLRRGSVCGLCLSVIGCVASDAEVMDNEQRTLIRNALMTNEACAAVVQALQFSLGEQQARGVSGLSTMSESLSAISLLCDFDADVRSALVDFDVVRNVTDAVRGFAITNTTLIHSSLRTICAVRMCDATLALTKSSVGLNRLRDAQMGHMLRNIKVLFQSDLQVVESAEKAIAVLSA